MAKEDLLEFDGTVVELLPDARFRVKLENGHEMLAYTAGKMKKNRIRTLVGELSAGTRGSEFRSSDMGRAVEGAGRRCAGKAG